MAKLKDIGVIITGNTPKTSDPKNYETTDIPFIKPSDISDDAISYLHNSEFYISEYAREKSRIVPVDSILFTCIGIIGKIAVNKVECAFNQQINAIIPDKSKCLTDYLVYALQSKKRLLQETANAPVVPILNKTQFSEIEIELPSLEQQEKISVQLNKINDLISQRNLQLSKLDELVKSRFIELFGSQCNNEKNYPYGKIDDVAEIYLGLTHTPEYIETGVKFISAKNTSCDYLDLSDVKYISEEEYASAPAGAKPRKGDVLFSRVGSNLGHPVILDIDEELCTFVSLGYLRTKGRVTNLYLKHWMRDDFFSEQVRRKVVGGGQPNLNTGWLKEFRIIIPPMDIQEQFAAFVEQTDKSKLAVQQSLEKLEALKKSLMQQYFG